MLGPQNVVHFLVMSMTAGLLWGCSPGEPKSGMEVVSGAQDTAMMELGADTLFANKPWLNPDLAYGSVTDIDGNAYATIRIGKHEWMAENLNVSRYQNGDTIPHIIDDGEWSELTAAGWCYYDNSPDYGVVVGKLYNWYVVSDKRNVCPSGWRVPTDAEWRDLEIAAGVPESQVGKASERGGAIEAGRQLKSGHWANFDFLWTLADTMFNALGHDADTSATANRTGFSALAGGVRGLVAQSGDFSLQGNWGMWWALTSENEPNIWVRTLRNQSNGIGRDKYALKTFGMSMRCVRD